LRVSDAGVILLRLVNQRLILFGRLIPERFLLVVDSARNITTLHQLFITPQVLFGQIQARLRCAHFRHILRSEFLARLQTNLGFVLTQRGDRLIQLGLRLLHAVFETSICPRRTELPMSTPTAATLPEVSAATSVCWLAARLPVPSKNRGS